MSSMKARHRPVGVCPGEGHKAGKGAETSLLLRNSERLGVAQPGGVSGEILQEPFSTYEGCIIKMGTEFLIMNAQKGQWF